MPAPKPSPPLRTPTVTFTRFGPSGTSQVVIIEPDGEWRFIPYRGSARASVVNHGRLTTAEQVALAATLADPRFRAEAALGPGACHGGSSYRLTTHARTDPGTGKGTGAAQGAGAAQGTGAAQGAGTTNGGGTDRGAGNTDRNAGTGYTGAGTGSIDASWTECDAAERPVLTDLIDRIVAAARF
ncbi:MAG: hypothetical protein QOI74_2601 [Micromonosporaceae bacterium]|nr:hypothetical protein [Micromonosporaceae bacterium]